MKQERNTFTRRDFIRSTIGAAALVGIGGKLGAQAPKPGRQSRVMLVRDEAVLNAENKVEVEVFKKMLDEAIIKVTGKDNANDGWRLLFKAGDTVGLVPTKALNPTHQELYDLVQEALLMIGISQDKIINVQQRDPEKVRICTALINMPGLKAHWLTGIGTVLKNYILFSGNPRDYHEANSTKLGAIWNLDFVKGKTRLNLVDALEPLCDKGPQVDPQYKWPYKGLIAGTDPVAVETVGLKIIMERRRSLKGESWPLSPPPVCVEAADKEYGLGTSNWEEIALEKFGWAKDILV